MEQQLGFSATSTEQPPNSSGPATIRFRKRTLEDLPEAALIITRKHIKIDTTKYMEVFAKQ